MSDTQQTIAKVVLKDTVTTRKVPMTEEGMSNLRAIRAHYQDLYKKRTGNDVELPFPSVFDMVLRDFVKVAGIEPLPSSN